MAKETIGKPDESLETILIRRREFQAQEQPNLEHVDTIILSEGPRAKKTATVWRIRNARTGEFHHHSLKIESLDLTKKHGWRLDADHSITLDDEDESPELDKLRAVLAVIASDTAIDRDRSYLVTVTNTRVELKDISVDALLRLVAANQRMGSDLARTLLRWMAGTNAAPQVVERLTQLGVSDLTQLSALVGVADLKKALGTWQDNKSNADEEFWQREFQKHTLLLAQIFAFPIVLVKGKAHLGGKSVVNTGGSILDFLMKCETTLAAAIIEIKTPCSPLLGRVYRQNVYPPSPELAGAMAQALHYKHDLLTEWRNLQGPNERDGVKLDVFNPPTILIAGNSAELVTIPQRKSFELLRGQQRDIVIVTFDELYRKLEILLAALEGTLRAPT